MAVVDFVPNPFGLSEKNHFTSVLTPPLSECLMHPPSLEGGVMEVEPLQHQFGGIKILNLGGPDLVHPCSPMWIGMDWPFEALQFSVGKN